MIGEQDSLLFLPLTPPRPMAMEQRIRERPSFRWLDSDIIQRNGACGETLKTHSSGKTRLLNKAQYQSKWLQHQADFLFTVEDGAHHKLAAMRYWKATTSTGRICVHLTDSPHGAGKGRLMHRSALE